MKNYRLYLEDKAGNMFDENTFSDLEKALKEAAYIYSYGYYASVIVAADPGAGIYDIDPIFENGLIDFDFFKEYINVAEILDDLSGWSFEVEIKKAADSIVFLDKENDKTWIVKRSSDIKALDYRRFEIDNSFEIEIKTR